MKTGLTTTTIAVPNDTMEAMSKFSTTWWNGAGESMGTQETAKWFEVSRKMGWGNLAIPLGALLVDTLVKSGWIEEPDESSDGEVGEHEDEHDAADAVSP